MAKFTTKTLAEVPPKPVPQPGKRGPRRGVKYTRRHMKVCEWCKQPFMSARSDARYCPRPRLCSQQARRAATKREVDESDGAT
jgi:hypothetical protein